MNAAATFANAKQTSWRRFAAGERDFTWSREWTVSCRRWSSEVLEVAIAWMKTTVKGVKDGYKRILLSVSLELFRPGDRGDCLPVHIFSLLSH